MQNVSKPQIPTTLELENRLKELEKRIASLEAWVKKAKRIVPAE